MDAVAGCVCIKFRAPAFHDWWPTTYKTWLMRGERVLCSSLLRLEAYVRDTWRAASFTSRHKPRAYQPSYTVLETGMVPDISLHVRALGLLLITLPYLRTGNKARRVYI